MMRKMLVGKKTVPVTAEQVLSKICSDFKSKLVLDKNSQLIGELGYNLKNEYLNPECNPALKKVLSLELASRPQINKFNKHQAIRFFARGPNDTGSPEVQAGILTVRLAYVAQHANNHVHDYKSVRMVTKLIHDRKKHLKYLRRLSLERLYTLLDKLGLPHNYLEQFENPYLHNYRSSKKNLHSYQLKTKQPKPIQLT